MTYSKYKNVITEIDGIKFDSKKEANYYGILKMRKLAGEILGFARQIKYPLEVNGMLICTYIADFLVVDINEKETVIDVKSDITRKKRDYRIKNKLMKAVYGIDIIEV